jgi:hypothetical protein
MLKMADLVFPTIKLSRAASRVKWLKADETNVSRSISVLVLRELSFLVRWGTQQIVMKGLRDIKTSKQSSCRWHDTQLKKSL